MQSEQPQKFPYWPFWLADGLLLFWAAWVWGFSAAPHSLAAQSFYILAVLLALGFGVAPVFIERVLWARERQRRLEAEFQSQVAHALGEILNRLAAQAPVASVSEPVRRSESAAEVDWLRPALEVIGEQLTSLQGQLDRLTEKEDAAQGKKGGRRGVNGILYPPKSQASWVGQDAEEPPGAEASAVVLEQAESPELEDNGEPVSAAESVDAVEVWVMALIGIGNRPYLRGNLPGLSVDKGVPMEFMEIGKWRWIGEGTEEWKDWTVEVWLNDTVPAKNRPVTVTKPVTEIRPVFP